MVCVSWNDDRAFCQWLTKREREAGRLPEGLEYRLPTEAEWEYACRGGRPRAIFWWGDELEEGEGRLNISACDFLPGRKKTWPLGKAPWSDGYAFVSPVDHYGERGRNGFGLADMCGGVWEFVLDHFDPEGAHEEAYFADTDPHPVCRGGNYFDVPGNARWPSAWGSTVPLTPTPAMDFASAWDAPCPANQRNRKRGAASSRQGESHATLDRLRGDGFVQSGDPNGAGQSLRAVRASHPHLPRRQPARVC